MNRSSVHVQFPPVVLVSFCAPLHPRYVSQFRVMYRGIRESFASLRGRAPTITLDRESRQPFPHESALPSVVFPVLGWGKKTRGARVTQQFRHLPISVLVLVLLLPQLLLLLLLLLLPELFCRLFGVGSSSSQKNIPGGICLEYGLLLGIHLVP